MHAPESACAYFQIHIPSKNIFAALHLAALKGHSHVVQYLINKAKYETERGYDKELMKILNSYKHGARILSWLQKESRPFDVNVQDMVLKPKMDQMFIRGDECHVMR